MEKAIKKTAIVSTSIRVPKMLEEYCQNIAALKYGNIEIFMIGDKKTPSEARQFCERLTSCYNIPVHYLGIK